MTIPTNPTTNTGMWLSGNEPRGFVIIGSRPCRRVELFQDALRREGLPPARLVAYPDLLSGRTRLEEWVTPGDIVRIESPGKDFESQRALLLAGADDEGPLAIPSDVLADLAIEKGRILNSRQWYFGLRRAMRHIEGQLEHCPAHRLAVSPRSIEVLFDKRRCHAAFSERGLSVPKSLGPILSFEQLIETMRRREVSRVFVKPAYGSSASGVVAFRMNRDRMQAMTTTEMVQLGDEWRFYNSRRPQQFSSSKDIARLIDMLCGLDVQVEEWIPKAALAGKSFDVRVVVIGGRARHRVLRLSRTPITNLHLLNERSDEKPLLDVIHPERWRAALETCEKVAATFPENLSVGVDLAFATGLKRHFILEANAFGDLLPDVLHQGVDTYTAEIRELSPNPLKEFPSAENEDDLIRC